MTKLIGKSRFTSLDSDKLRGGYYTSSLVADWLCEWAIRSKMDTVLEPSCGDGSFMVSAAKQLRLLGATKSNLIKQLRGIEISTKEADQSRSNLNAIVKGIDASCILNADFFEWLRGNEEQKFDVALGNPPFIRYQSFPEKSRDLAMSEMELQGLKPNRLTNIWVPFVVAATARLNSNGRLAMVLPAELLQVTYASQLRSFLVDRFSRIDVVACNELFFENAEQEVVLLLADGAHPITSPTNVCRVALTESKTISDIVGSVAKEFIGTASPKDVQHDNEKWLKYFLSPSEIGLMRKLRESKACVDLSHHASIDVGVVTGKNEFFVLTRDQVEEFGLQRFAVPLLGRAAHLRGSIVSKTEWEQLASDGERVFLFEFDKNLSPPLTKAAKSYVARGEEQGFDRGYKCSIREPWYAVPSIWKPDCFFFRQIYDFPRVVLNKAQATSTDTIHRLSTNGDASLLAANIYTHLSAASAEIEGRSYGGGVLELEPTEAERMLVPNKLYNGLPICEADKMIRAGRLQEVLDINDKQILIDGLGLNTSDVASLRQIWQKMRDRRLARTKRPKARKPDTTSKS